MEYLVRDETGTVDRRVETILSDLQRGKPLGKAFDNLFNDAVQEYVRPGAPKLVTAFLARQPAAALAYLALIHLEFYVVLPFTANWPMGGFDYMPDAQCAIGIYRNGDQTTKLSPGADLNRAALAAILQYARERCKQMHDQGELPFVN
jgi:hypothetical protein